MARWTPRLMLAATLLLSGCTAAPRPEVMARAIIIAQPSGEALALGDWTKLGVPDEARQRQMAEQGVGARAYRAGLARLQRDSAYREQVAGAMLRAAVR